ncbi:hypothetical protein L798_03506 [Zootermopsis nevadensis]|uniref:Uncharacterized protein n=1 Tax=Zootermopsis nevadensis TaxID=136037 RepID=A0A067QIF9_ZOONE|nr:hypothetical protein L798_03506 [Zootermopsis nevadensis]
MERTGMGLLMRNHESTMGSETQQEEDTMLRIHVATGMTQSQRLVKLIVVVDHQMH